VRIPLRANGVRTVKSENLTPAYPPGETAPAVDEDFGEAVRAAGKESGRVTTKVAAKVLGVPRRMVQEYARRGELRRSRRAKA
jgi:hypothetical protein